MAGVDFYESPFVSWDHHLTSYDSSRHDFDLDEYYCCFGTTVGSQALSNYGTQHATRQAQMRAHDTSALLGSRGKRKRTREANSRPGLT